MALSGGRSSSALTDSSGAYQFTSLSGNADYSIVPVKTGYKFTPASKSVTALSANVANMDFTALRKYYIKGKVKTLSGATISNVVMTLSGSESQSVVTDSNGEYLFEDLPENAVYTVIAVKSGYEFAPSERTTELLTSIDGWDFLAQDYGAMQKGEMIVIGSLQGQGTVNPDAGDTAKLFFKGSQTGTFDLHILTLTGEAVWETSLEAPAGEGVFEWVPGDVASGTYIAHIKGPGIDASKKIIILR
jgi:hypothetical protein